MLKTSCWHWSGQAGHHRRQITRRTEETVMVDGRHVVTALALHQAADCH